MLQGYNLAFMPINNSKIFTQLAHDTTIAIKPGDYLLGPASLPHVSICHFMMEETHIETIWKRVQELAIPTQSFTFSTRRSKIYLPDAYRDVTECSVSLIPNHKDVLMEIHLQIANIIQKPLNAAFADYDPHLTLFSSYDIKGCEQLNHTPDLRPPLEDTFAIALGTIDRIGQVTRVLMPV